MTLFGCFPTLDHAEDCALIALAMIIGVGNGLADVADEATRFSTKDGGDRFLTDLPGVVVQAGGYAAEQNACAIGYDLIMGTSSP